MSASRDSVLKLEKETPYLYRASVIETFRDLYNSFKSQYKHPLGKLSGVLQDMVIDYSGDTSNLKSDQPLGRKIDNILRSGTAGNKAEDADTFILIEKFIQRHAPDQLAELNISRYFEGFYKQIESFWGITLDNKFGEAPEGVIPLDTIDDGKLYEIDFVNRNAKTSNIAVSHSERVPEADRFILALKSFPTLGNDPSGGRFAIIYKYCNTPQIFHGIYHRKTNHLVFRSIREQQPLCLYVDNPRVEGAFFTLIRSTSIIEPNGNITTQPSAEELISGVPSFQLTLNTIKEQARLKTLIDFTNVLIRDLAFQKIVDKGEYYV